MSSIHFNGKALTVEESLFMRVSSFRTNTFPLSNLFLFKAAIQPVIFPFIIFYIIDFYGYVVQARVLLNPLKNPKKQVHSYKNLEPFT
jgi:hypothetical protein